MLLDRKYSNNVSHSKIIKQQDIENNCTYNTAFHMYQKKGLDRIMLQVIRYRKRQKIKKRNENLKPLSYLVSYRRITNQYRNEASQMIALPSLTVSHHRVLLTLDSLMKNFDNCSVSI